MTIRRITGFKVRTDLLANIRSTCLSCPGSLVRSVGAPCVPQLRDSKDAAASGISSPRRAHGQPSHVMVVPAFRVPDPDAIARIEVCGKAEVGRPEGTCNIMSRAHSVGASGPPAEGGEWS
jgi:hypothetical protein